MKAFIARDSDGRLYLYYSNPYSNPPIKSEKNIKNRKNVGIIIYAKKYS